MPRPRLHASFLKPQPGPHIYRVTAFALRVCAFYYLKELNLYRKGRQPPRLGFNPQLVAEQQDAIRLTASTRFIPIPRKVHAFPHFLQVQSKFRACQNLTDMVLRLVSSASCSLVHHLPGISASHFPSAGVSFLSLIPQRSASLIRIQIRCLEPFVLK